MSSTGESASTVVLMGFLGVLLGLVGSVVSAARVQVGSVTVPWGAVLAALTLDWRNAMMVGTALLLCALAGAVLALTQKFAGPGHALYFYSTPAGNIAMGTFSNRNFLAAQLFTAVPFVAALAG